jgi:AcrR family transcriptional regulator
VRAACFGPSCHTSTSLNSDRPKISNGLIIGDRLSVSLVQWLVSVKPLRARQAEATRSLLIAVARENFTEHGYAATSIDDIIQQAGVARGALYHHFSGKEALFRAVYETVEDEVFSRVMEAATSQASPWDAVRAGLSAFLDACLEPAFRRIVVLDSVSVLQSQVMEVGIDPVELPMLRTVLTPLLGTTTFGGIAIDALTHVALGGLYGASLYIARASDPRAARAEVDLVLDKLITGLLRPAAE